MIMVLKDVNHPKNFITRILSQYKEDYSTENFIKIAEKINVENLKHSCPNSFTVFYNDISQTLSTIK